jgi:hypothetical protein
MTLSSATRTAAVIALLAHSPVLAQDGGQHAEQTVLQIATAAAVPTFVPAVGVPSRPETTWMTPAAHDGSWTAYGTKIWTYVHTTTVQPAMNLARNSGEWIASSTSAAASAAQDAGQWLATNATTVVFTVQDGGGWVVTSSSSALNSAVETASATYASLTAMGNWSTGIVKQVESHLRGDGNSEFALLVKDSGFALANIRVEVGIIPELAVEFRHERNITADEDKAFQVKVSDYVKKSKGAVGYFEGLLLGRLAKASQYTGGMRISEVHIDVFPLPGLEVFFDPFRFEEEQTDMLIDAFQDAETDKTKLKALNDRVLKLEAVIATLKSVKVN